MPQGVSRFPELPGLLRLSKVLMDSGSCIVTDISEELVKALQGQPGMTQTALTQAFLLGMRVW